MAKVLISMQSDFLEKVDAIAEKEQRTRSELIRQAIRVYMRRRKQPMARTHNRNAELIEALLFS